MQVKTLKGLFSKFRLLDPWRYKAPALIAIPYFVICTRSIGFAQSAWLLSVSLALIIGFAGFGYVTNDWADIAKDKEAGKFNMAAGLSKAQLCALLFGFMVLVALPWLILPFTVFSAILIALELTLFVLYAFRPLRLKEKGFAGVFVDALYAHVVPAVFAAYTFCLAKGGPGNGFIAFAIILGLWQLAWGIRNIILHQLDDFENDLKVNNRTFVLLTGKVKALKLIQYVLLPFEVFMFFAFLTQTVLLTDVNLLVLYVVFFAALALANRDKLAHPALRNFCSFLFDDFYLECLPLCFLFFMVLNDWRFLWLVLVHIVIFRKNIITRFISNAFG